MTLLALNSANQIIEKAISKARELNMAPLTVVVLDTAGHIKALQREDGATMIRQQIATAKAWARSAWAYHPEAWQAWPNIGRIL